MGVLLRDCISLTLASSPCSILFPHYSTLPPSASAIYVLGDKKNDHGLYEVTLSSNSSGSTSQVLSGVSGCGGAFGETCEQQLPSLKYFASNLANETYTLRLANIAGENNSYFGESVVPAPAVCAVMRT